MIEEWINVGKFQDYLDGKYQIIIYANTENLMWHIGVIYGISDPLREELYNLVGKEKGEP